MNGVYIALRRKWVCSARWNDKKRSKICFETLEIFAPLAERLGINAIQRELEDRCFAVLKPETRDSILKRLKLIYSQDELNIPYITKEIETLKAQLADLSTQMKRAGEDREKQNKE